MVVRECWLALLVLAIAGCAEVGAPARVEVPLDSAAGEVAFDLAGPGGAVLLVPVEINGQGPFHFVFDTGATLTCVDRTLVERLALPTQSGAVGVGAGVSSAGRVDLVRLDSIRLGEASAHDLSACVVDLQHTRSIGVEIDGLVGLNLLREFLVTLDFERGVVRLEAPGSEER